MYTVTVKIAARGAIYHEDGTSATGHMWYSISNGNSTESYGFAPAKDSMPVSPRSHAPAWECIPQLFLLCLLGLLYAFPSGTMGTRENIYIHKRTRYNK
jgi:hypothetical protein